MTLRASAPAARPGQRLHEGLSAMTGGRAGWRNGWYVVPYEVSFRDIDFFGHVNNAVYFTYFEWARTRYWLDLHRASDPRSIDFIVAHAECDFRRQVAFGEDLDLGVRISEMRNSSVTFENEIRKSRGGEVAATGKVVVVLFDFSSQSKKPVSATLRHRIEAFQSGSGADAAPVDGG
jgi:acyl-CoA thioester hydrolase